MNESAIRCLTPYGVRGFDILNAECVALIPSLCLTPYGVRGFDIGQEERRGAASSCA